ncbi:conjugal transfer protein TraF [Paraburkholderia sp. UCT31]|uniref:conjugal transfer protein TraF n=1 Tax=Paraburkholderia sp. UCT31 TaxID=2615209 RepID=UPI00165657BE|nr:conjugal transfer protein TraF [Paraburkholderia sp. UCT31]MBC8737234.1 conjugal transfer protein TraF [Paraburkholderia sp. UCT31]
MTRLLAALLCALPLIAFAQTAEREAPATSLQQNAEKGWFFYEQAPKKEEPVAEQKQPAPTPPPPKEAKKEDKCKDPKAWTADCGFVDPGKDMAFQEKERDALLQNMSLSNNDPKAVEAFQYYMRWVMGRASEVANLWYYNTVQNPDLDASVNQPISSFGLRLMTDVRSANAQEMYAALKKEDAILILFSRSDCEFCHSMAPTYQNVAHDTGLPLYDASLDDTCLPGMTANCRTGKDSIPPAEKLSVTTVPALFLYIQPSTWIRVATGVTDSATIEGRIVSFFSAYRAALLKGISNGSQGRASVDFSDADKVSGNQKGVTAPAESKLPTDDDVKKMLGDGK